jgi:hypothetical protein
LVVKSDPRSPFRGEEDLPAGGLVCLRQQLSLLAPAFVPVVGGTEADPWSIPIVGEVGPLAEQELADHFTAMIRLLPHGGKRNPAKGKAPRQSPFSSGESNLKIVEKPDVKTGLGGILDKKRLFYFS